MTRFVAVTLVLAGAAAYVKPSAGIGVMAIAVAWAIVKSTRCGPTTLLTAYIVVLFVIPAAYIFGPLGAVGTPANLIALVAFGWWVFSRLSLTSPSARGLQPVRLAVGGFLVVMSIAYAWSFREPLEGVLVRSVDRTIIGLFALGGIALLAADGVESRRRLDILLRRLVGAGTFLAIIGLIQFATGSDPAEWFALPGLKLNGSLIGITSRTLRRVSGTALHGIEFGVVLAMILPIALHYAFYAPPEHRKRRWASVAVIGLAIPMSISRSAVFGLVAVAVMLFPTWDWRRRLNVSAAAIVAAGAMRAVIPGLLGTLKSLILNASSDPSVTGRTEDYQAIARLYHDHPWLGLGLGTYIPEKFRYLDNQYLGQIVETGLIGLAALLVLLVVGLAVARGPRHRVADPESRDLGQALAAAILVATLTFGTFDALSFPMNAGVLFLVIGCAGAYWRLDRDGVLVSDEVAADASGEHLPDEPAVVPRLLSAGPAGPATRRLKVDG